MKFLLTPFILWTWTITCTIIWHDCDEYDVLFFLITCKSLPPPAHEYINLSMNANQIHLFRKTFFLPSRQWNAIVIAGANLLVNEFVSIIFSVHLHFHTSNNRLFYLLVCFFLLSIARYREWEIDTILTVMAIVKKKNRSNTRWDRLAFHFIHFMGTWIHWMREPCHYRITYKSFGDESVESCVHVFIVSEWCDYAIWCHQNKITIQNDDLSFEYLNCSMWIFSSAKRDKCGWKMWMYRKAKKRYKSKIRD